MLRNKVYQPGEIEVYPEVDENKLIVRSTSNPIDFMAAKPTPTGKFIIYCHTSLPTEKNEFPKQIYLSRSVVTMADYYDILQHYDPFPARKYGFSDAPIHLPSDHFYKSSTSQEFLREEVDKILASFPTYLRFKEDIDPIVETMEA